MKSKIHRATVTRTDLDYVGSITIDASLAEAAHLVEGEKVQVVNINNGERLETYVVLGERGSGSIGMNGAAARKAVLGDLIIIIAYAQMEAAEAKAFQPAVIFPNAQNSLEALQK